MTRVVASDAVVLYVSINYDQSLNCSWGRWWDDYKQVHVGTKEWDYYASSGSAPTIAQIVNALHNCKDVFVYDQGDMRKANGKFSKFLVDKFNLKNQAEVDEKVKEILRCVNPADHRWSTLAGNARFKGQWLHEFGGVYVPGITDDTPGSYVYVKVVTPASSSRVDLVSVHRDLDGDGYSAETDKSDQWPKRKNIYWKRDLNEYDFEKKQDWSDVTQFAKDNLNDRQIDYAQREMGRRR